ncbi:MAG TPA: hypothetical protein VNN20_10885 [Thermodesulfobacteriota bacterium]|nr:hypothetical protein [Thermodesulfobacteriota bacterium]
MKPVQRPAEKRLLRVLNKCNGMIPQNIKKKHVIKAIEEVKRVGISKEGVALVGIYNIEAT